MSHMILLGAGASVEAKLPTAKDLTAELLTHFSKTAPEEHTILKHVQDRLERDGREVDIEQLLNAIENIAELFAMNLYSVAELGLTTEGFAQDNLSRSFYGLVERSKHYLKKRLTCSDELDLSYLNPLGDFLEQQEAQQKKVVIATLNYDNIIELLCRQRGISYSYGLEEYERKFKITPPEKGVHLLKLHGSVTWILREESEMGTAVSALEVLKEDEASEESETRKRMGGSPAIIFGERNKLNPRGPFLDLFLAFRDELFEHSSTNLTVIGYSFRDFHVNHIIDKWVNRGTSAKLTYVDLFADEFIESRASYIVWLHHYKYGPETFTYTPVAKTAGEGLKDTFNKLRN